MTKLSILICTLPERQHKLNVLLNSLELQRTDEVEILTDNTDRHLPTGTKRNNLISRSTGEYFCFIDDDDNVPSYYVKEILFSIGLSGPDVITFKGYMTTNGVNRENFTIKLGSPYVSKDGHHYRFPNHLCVFKKSLVQHIKFPDIYQQEDYLWAKKINDAKILKTEGHITVDMYHYDCWSKPVNRMRR